MDILMKTHEAVQMGMPSEWLDVHGRSSGERYGRDVDWESPAPRPQVWAG